MHGAEGSWTLIRLIGEADITTPALGEALQAEVAKKPRHLLVDASELAFIDSSAIHEIIKAYRRLRADSGQLTLVNPSPQVFRILQVSGLDTVIPVHSGRHQGDAT